ncbi:hypothetical protein BDQ12DRAFT_738787 [Crucibulum laeve]|uniref:Chromo domain-containing protein n=1 Tax=Crucibulum laeve TaxID=68775 RepID=A0A5C3LL88_9AGAR|nr:hypothetical protein BDQ12DRAFT_738787 [Crucibulum laeve]
MASEDESLPEASSVESQFVPREDDLEVLWEVENITAEKGKLYKVKWAGLDPATNKPWKQTWVPKHDCTPDIVKEWKMKQAKKKQKEERRQALRRESIFSKKSRTSTASTMSIRSPASSSTATRRERSTTATLHPPSEEPTPKPATNGKRKYAPRKSNAGDSASVQENGDTPTTRLRKKRKVDEEIFEVKESPSSPANMTVRPPPRKSVAVRREDSEEDSEEDDPPPPRYKGTGKAVARTEEEPSNLWIKAKRTTTNGSSSSKNTTNIPTNSQEEIPPPAKKSADKPRGRPKAPSLHSPRFTAQTVEVKGVRPKTERHRPPRKQQPVETLEYRVSPESITQDEPEAHQDIEANDTYEDYGSRMPEFAADGAQDDFSPANIPLFIPSSPSPSLDDLDLSYPPVQEATSSKNGKASTSHSSTRTGARSYENEIIPETDTSRNNTQSQETQPDAASPIRPTTPPRTSIISKMKPRTPASAGGSRRSIVHDEHAPRSHAAAPPARSKPLGPIPVLSPSRFHPHLPSSSVPPSSTINTTEDIPASSLDSIEDFDSPEKRSTSHAKGKGRPVDRHSRSSSMDDAADLIQAEVLRKGIELAEAAKERRRRERGVEPKQKLSLVDLAPSSRKKHKEKLLILRRQEEVVEPEIQNPDDSIESVVMQEMEDAFVDLSGGVTQSDDVYMDEGTGVARLLVRHEEEENTQDIMKDMEEARRAHVKPVLEPPEPEVDTTLATQGTGYDPRDESFQPDQSMEQPDGAQMGSSLAADEGPGSTSSRAELNHVPEKNDNPRQRAELCASPLHEPPHATSAQMSMDTQAKDELAATTTLLHAKSEELSQLEVRLSAEQAKSGSLQQEVSDLKKALMMVNSGPSSKEAELEVQLVELQATLAAERARWEAERTALNSSLNTAVREKESAEKERSFFHEQYAKASGFVSGIRSENTKLEKRATIAEAQAKTGVAAAKLLFERRIKDLEDDVRTWKRTAMFAIEKDSRTNDEIRKRAALYPELEVKLRDMERALLDSAEQFSELEDEKDKVMEDLVTELNKWKSETLRLNLELNGGNAMLNRVKEESQTDGALSETVYRCQWRPEGGSDSCEAVFSTITDLEHHLSDHVHV